VEAVSQAPGPLMRMIATAPPGAVIGAQIVSNGLMSGEQ